LATQKLELDKMKVAVELQKENARVSSQQQQAEQRTKLDVMKTVLAQKRPNNGDR
jgi:hypothetical protein